MAVEKPILSIGVIGTPGCGKTTFCQKSMLPTISLADYAREHDCLGEIEADGAAEMDVEKLSKSWVNPNELTLIDGHLAHHLPVDALIVIRCSPEELKNRLKARGYSEEKVRQNVEVEMLGGPWNDLINDYRPIFEGIEGAMQWITDGCPIHSTPESATDWLSRP